MLSLCDGKKDVQRPYDHFRGGIAPRSLLCVRKQAFSFFIKHALEMRWLDKHEIGMGVTHGFDPNCEPEMSELRTGFEPTLQTGTHRKPQFAIQFELQTPPTHYGN